MKCSIMLHFIWVYTVCKSTHLEVSQYKGLKIDTLCFHGMKNLNMKAWLIRINNTSIRTSYLHVYIAKPEWQMFKAWKHNIILYIIIIYFLSVSKKKKRYRKDRKLKRQQRTLLVQWCKWSNQTKEFYSQNVCLFWPFFLFLTETASVPLNLDLLLFVGLPLIGTFIVLGIILMLIHFKHKKKMDSLHVQEHHLLADEGIRAQQVGDSTLGVSFTFYASKFWKAEVESKRQN